MAVPNFTTDASHKSYEDHYCSTEFIKGRNNELMVLIAITIFVSVTASLGNALILAALHKESSLHPPSKLLLRNLATNDLAVGIISMPLGISYLISSMNEQWDICRFVFVGFLVTNYILCLVSLLTLTAISVDRLLALLLGLRYRQVVTLKRIHLIVIIFWFCCIIGSTMFLWSYNITSWWVSSATLLCLVTSVFSYAKIFFALRRHNQVQAQGQQNQTVLRNRARYKKTVNSALWIQLTLFVCYLPYPITDIVVLRRGLSPTVRVAKAFASTLVFLNSSLNPILYCLKIREVRQAVKDIVKGLFCSAS